MSLIFHNSTANFNGFTILFPLLINLFRIRKLFIYFTSILTLLVVLFDCLDKLISRFEKMFLELENVIEEFIAVYRLEALFRHESVIQLL